MSETRVTLRASDRNDRPADPAAEEPEHPYRLFVSRSAVGPASGGLPVDELPPIVEPVVAAAEPIAPETAAELPLVGFAEPAPVRRPVRRSFLAPGLSPPGEEEWEPPPPTDPMAPCRPVTGEAAASPAPEPSDTVISAVEADARNGAAEEVDLAAPPPEDLVDEEPVDEEPVDGEPGDREASEPDRTAPWWRDIYTGQPGGMVPAMAEGGEAPRDGRQTRVAAARAWVATHRRRLAGGAALVAVVLAASVAVGIGPLGGLGHALWDTHRRAEPAATPPGPPTDAAARVSYYLARAQAGNAQAQLDLAILYAKGEGVAQDYATAATWFRAAAEQGVPRAQYDLGVLYERGRGIPVNYGEALSWYRKAAESNYALAQYNLAVAYTRGQGTQQDFKAAATWYTRAASQGVVPAMVNLAILYERGEGVEASTIDAFGWYRAAAKRGNQQAAKRADELIEVLAVRDRPRAEARADEIAATIRDPGGAAAAPTAAAGASASRPRGETTVRDR